MEALQFARLISHNGIHFPVDFSQVAETALPFVCDIPRRFNYQVVH